LVAVAIAVCLLGDDFASLLRVSRLGIVESFPSLMSWSFTAVLFYLVWEGHRWARWLMVGLQGLDLVFIVPYVLLCPHPLVIRIGVRSGFALVTLAFLPSVSPFLAPQRGRPPDDDGCR